MMRHRRGIPLPLFPFSVLGPAVAGTGNAFAPYIPSSLLQGMPWNPARLASNYAGACAAPAVTWTRASVGAAPPTS